MSDVAVRCGCCGTCTLFKTQYAKFHVQELDLALRTKDGAGHAAALKRCMEEKTFTAAGFLEAAKLCRSKSAESECRAMMEALWAMLVMGVAEDYTVVAEV